jgi:hypothetical protein
MGFVFVIPVLGLQEIADALDLTATALSVAYITE